MLSVIRLDGMSKEEMAAVMKAAVMKARDLGFMRRMQNKAGLQLGWKANKQKYFKDRNGMCQ